MSARSNRIGFADLAARRRLVAEMVAATSRFGYFRLPRRMIAFALFLAILAGVLHRGADRGCLCHEPGHDAIGSGEMATGPAANRSEVDMRAATIATFIVVGAKASAQDGCALLVQWGSPQTGGFDNQPQAPLSQIALNYSLGMGLRADGGVVCWGSPDLRALAPASQDFVKVSAGTDWGLGLRLDGTVSAWGGNSWGQCNVPAGRFRDIAAGDWHSLALTTKGQPISWGSSNFGLGETPQVVLASVATGNWHSLGITPDGFVIGWGWNQYGQTIAPRGVRFQSVAGGWKHSVGIRLDGTIAGWGSDEFRCISEIPTGSNFVQIDSNGWRSIAMRSDGSVVIWGTGDPANPGIPGSAPQERFESISIGGTVAAGLACPCPGDVVRDAAVNGADLATILVYWGTNGSQFPGVDIDGDGVVNGSDLATVLAAWGPCPR